MKAIVAHVKGRDILFEAIEEPVEIIGSKARGRQTQSTGITEDVSDAYDRAKRIIYDIAEDIGQQLVETADSIKPKKLEIEFSMGFSAEGGIWIISGKANAGLKVKMVWE